MTSAPPVPNFVGKIAARPHAPGVSIPHAAGLAVLAVSCAVLLGWELGFEVLKRVSYGLVAMNPATAAAFALMAIALVLSGRAEIQRFLAHAAALLTSTIGVLKLCDILIGTDIGIDRLLFAHALAGSATTDANPMAPNTALNMVMAGLAFVLLSGERRVLRALGQAFALVTLLLAAMAIIGYAYGALVLYHLGYFPMALNTAVTFLVVVVGLLWLRPDFGAMSIITSKHLGGLTARQLLPCIVGLPFILGLILVYVLQQRHLDAVSGTAMFVVANIAVLVAVTAGVAMRLNRLAGDLATHSAALEKATRAADAANRAKSNFLANMSHEMRTPMNGVLGMLEILVHTRLDLEQSRIVNTIRTSARTLLGILNDILDFSKIEANQLKIEHIPAKVTDIVEATTKLFLGAAMAKNISIRCFVASSIRGQHLTDPIRLQQILGNLVSNAIKFTAEGIVTITGDLLRDEDSASWLSLCVRDTGIGIAPDVQARLFKPFVQADDTTARKFGGTGLGLSICLRLAKLMNGSISLESAVGQGTCATFRLPVTLLDAGAPELSLNLEGIKVALFGSDATEQTYLAGDLCYWGANVERASMDAPCGWDCGIILAPAVLEPDVRQWAGALPTLAAPRRFVFYVFDDEATDSHSAAGDAIRTTALSRARIVTAVAVAAGRKSPELESRPEEFEKADPKPDRNQAISERRLVLLAEDHPLNREVIIRQVELLGYAIDAVENGVAALAALEETPYGLVLTDCNMPEIDGFELTRRIRTSTAAWRDLPIVALTANAMAGEAEKCLATGMNDFLSKPVDMAGLRACLEKWLPGASILNTPTISPLLRSASEVLDLSLLESCFGTDETTIRSNLERFLETLRSDLSQLAVAIAAKDRVQTEQIAHRLKGAARFVGGSRLASAGEAIEAAAEARDWFRINQCWPTLESASDEIRVRINELWAA